MKTAHHVLTATLISSAAVGANVFVGFDGTVCGAGEKAYGVSLAAADADEPMGVCVMGVLVVLSGGAIEVGAEVESDASGNAITKDTGVSNGWALDEATAAGELIRIVRGI